jgi:hypothetical protein
MAKIRINGDSSGYVEIAAPNAANNNTLEIGSGTKILTNHNLNVGNIGIGTASPDYLTTIAAGSGNTKLNLKRLNAAANENAFGSLFYTNSDGTDVASVRAHRESAADDAYLGLGTRNAGGSLTERLRINSAGLVGIGTDNPLNGLDVNQSEGRLRVNRFSHLLMQNTNDSTTDYWGISARNGGELDIGYGTPDGNSLIGGDKLTITSAGHTLPGADATQDLGSATKRWANIYSADLQLSNEGAANDIDGTWGKYTIQEGEDDLFLINRRSGKKYKFILQEVS